MKNLRSFVVETNPIAIVEKRLRDIKVKINEISKVMGDLIASSQIILLDEATSALDIKMKRELQDTMLSLFYNSKVDATVINVTHNIDEVIYLSNRVYVMQANPCKAHSVIDIDFGSAMRTSEIRKTLKYSEYTRKLESIMDSMV